MQGDEAPSLRREVTSEVMFLMQLWFRYAPFRLIKEVHIEELQAMVSSHQIEAVAIKVGDSVGVGSCASLCVEHHVGRMTTYIKNELPI